LLLKKKVKISPTGAPKKRPGRPPKKVKNTAQGRKKEPEVAEAENIEILTEANHLAGTSKRGAGKRSKKTKKNVHTVGGKDSVELEILETDGVQLKNLGKKFPAGAAPKNGPGRTSKRAKQTVLADVGKEEPTEGENIEIKPEKTEGEDQGNNNLAGPSEKER